MIGREVLGEFDFLVVWIKFRSGDLLVVWEEDIRNVFVWGFLIIIFGLCVFSMSDVVFLLDYYVWKCEGNRDGVMVFCFFV